MTESPTNEILIAHIINTVTQNSSFTCDLRPRTNSFYFLPKLSQQFLLPFFYYIVFEQVRQIQASSRTDNFQKENEQIQLEGTKLNHKFSFYPL